jgi:hypothetical protein
MACVAAFHVCDCNYNICRLAGTADSAAFGRQLVGAVQAAAQAALTTLEVQAANAAAGAGSAPAVLASDFADFPGCWQVVMHLLLPQQDFEQQLQGEAGEQQLQQALQAAAEHVAAAWPQSGGLLDMQLGQQQQQQHEGVHVHSFAAAAGRAAMQDQLMAAAAAEAGGPAGHAETYVLDSLATLTGAQAATAGIYLQPVVLPGNSSSSSSDNATAELCIAPAAVQLLHAARHNILRIVVAAACSDAPSAVEARCVLLDQTWELSNAPVGAIGGTRLPLELQLPATVEPQAQVLSVVVLQNAPTAAVSEGPASAEAAAEAEAEAAAGIGDASAAVLAKLPLLVLPAAAASELQALATGLTAEQGLAPAAAYQELLPLLQDLASVVSNMQHGSSASQNPLHRAMLAALEECFEAHGMEACQQLLALLDASAAAPAAAAEGGNASVQGEPTAAQPAAAAAPPPHSSAAAEDKDDSNEAAGQAVQSQQPTSNNSSSSSGSSSCCSVSCDSAIGSTFAASTPAMAALHACDAGALPDSACQVSVWSVLFRFPNAAAQAYASFKCTHMVKLDFLCMMIYAIGLIPTA